MAYENGWNKLNKLMHDSTQFDFADQVQFNFNFQCLSSQHGTIINLTDYYCLVHANLANNEYDLVFFLISFKISYVCDFFRITDLGRLCKNAKISTYKYST